MPVSYTHLGALAQHLLGHFEQHRPGLGLGTGREGADLAQHVAVIQLGIAARLDQAAQLACVIAVGALHGLREQVAVAAVAGKQGAGAEDTDVPLAAIQLAIGLLADLLQACLLYTSRCV